MSLCPSLRLSVTKNSNSKFSTLVLDRDLGFLRGHQTKPNQTIPNQTKGISVLGLDRDLGFSGGDQTKPYQTIPNQTKPRKIIQINRINPK